MGTGYIGGNSVKVGIGVEGLSDKKFLDSLLHREFSKIRFYIQSMGCRTKLISNASRLFEQWKECHFDAGFILIDRDKSNCVSQVIQEFDCAIQRESREPVPTRFLFLIVVIKEIESWYLSDEKAIQVLFPQSDYRAPSDTGTIGAEGLLKSFWKTERKSSFNKRAFAEMIAPKFDPLRAQEHSQSFAYFWARLRETLKKN